MSRFVLRAVRPLCALMLLVTGLGPAALVIAQETPPPKTVVVPGTIQSKLGCPGDWQPDCTNTALTYNADKDVWEGTFELPAGSYEYKVALNGSWAENYGLDRVGNGPNIPLRLADHTAVTFTYDHKTHLITDSVNAAGGGAAPVALQPVQAVIAGTLQSEAGCPGDWQPECVNTALTFDEEDEVWQGEFTATPGDDQDKKGSRYKVALNGGWSENYGANAQSGGADIPLSVSAPTPVKFYYDHATHWAADNVNNVIAVVVGTFQSELGCVRDNDPACLRSWLQDPDGDGAYGFVTAQLPAGEYEARVALNESAADVYGQDGLRGGAAITFNVPKDGQQIYFGFDAATRVLTISTSGAPKGNLSAARAYWVLRNTIAWKVLPPAAGATFWLHYSPEGGMKVGPAGIEGGQAVPLKYDDNKVPMGVFARNPHLRGYASLKLSADDLAKVPEMLKGQLAVSARGADGQQLDATSLQIPGMLDDVYAYDGPLGVTFDGDAPTLRVWAPTAQSVTLHLFADSTSLIDQTFPMTWEAETGVWSVRGAPDWKGRFYLYEVNVYVPKTGQVEANLVTDPYSFSLSLNSKRSQIVDLNDATLQPEGWEAVEPPPLAAPEDAVLYELHVRDFSVSDASVPAEERGTFKAFTHLDSNGMQHLSALAEAGLTHIHLLPAFDIASIDEDKSTWATMDEAALAALPPDSDAQAAAVNAIRDQDGFNWGYDPYHFTTPEGSFSTNPDGSARVLEFREMVQALNQVGLRVVMDVVYNHTNASGQTERSVLDKIVPGYYHRLNADGLVETSTCCQNTATEHALMEKLMIDSVLTWVKAYKVNGFRFDLMGHHMRSNMEHLRAALDALTLEKDGVDGRAIYVYGEGWNFGEVADNARGTNATQLNIGGTGIGVFNDRLRDGVRGGGPFSGFQEQGFVTGLSDDPNGTDQGSADEMKARLLRYQDWIRVGLAGNLRDYALVDRLGNTVTGAQVDYSGSPAGYTLDPQENIIYISAHDNEVLFDAIQAKAPASASVAERVRMQNLGHSLVMLAQGVPFFHAGDDLLRSKSLDRNSYNSGDWFNKLDFTYQSNNWGVGLPVEGQDRAPIIGPLLADPALKPAPADIVSAAAHFREMLQIRRSSALFRLRTAADVASHLTFLNTGPDQIPGLIVMQLTDMEGEDDDPLYEQVIVLFNANKTEMTFADAAWRGLPFELHPVQQDSADAVVSGATFDAANGAFTVPGRTTAVYVLSQAALESAPQPTATVMPIPTATRIPTMPSQAPTLAPTTAPELAPRPEPDASLAVWFILAMVLITGAVMYWSRKRGMEQ